MDEFSICQISNTSKIGSSCQKNLEQCTAILSTCNTDLITCNADLAACETGAQVFPGDGAGDGQALSYTDNGNGTFTDNNTKFMWEIKDQSGGVHDVDNTYSWTVDDGDLTDPDGTLFTAFLDKLNNKCDGDETTPCATNRDCAGIGNGKCGHAGFRDWCIPNVKKLQSIVDYGTFDPASSFPGATAASG